MAELVQEKDIVSVGASAILFTECSEDGPSHASGPDSHSSARSGSEGAKDTAPWRSFIHKALAPHHPNSLSFH